MGEKLKKSKSYNRYLNTIFKQDQTQQELFSLLALALRLQDISPTEYSKLYQAVLTNS